VSNSLSFVLIDESTAASTVLKPGLTRPVLEQMAQALTVYANRDVASYWGGSYLVRVGDGTILPGEIACAIVDVLPNAPGAVAYHDVNGSEVPIIFLALETCDCILGGGQTPVSAAMSHEIAETIGDFSVNLWADDGHGSEWAHELCDAVESWSYDILGVMVSDFVLPSFFAPGASGPWNYLATVPGSPYHVSGPLATAPGGYQIKRASGTGETQVNGTISTQKLLKKRHETSRTYQRGARP
jgi:hypothetical protein